LTKNKTQVVSRAQIHLLYTQTVKYQAAEKALFSQVKKSWSIYRNPILHNKGLPEERTLALKYFPDSINELLQTFHQKHHVVVNIIQKENLDTDFPFTLEFEYQVDDLPYTDPEETGSRFPLRTVVFDLNSGLSAQLAAAKEYLEIERMTDGTDFSLVKRQRRTDLASIFKNLSFLVHKDTSRKTYETLAKEYGLEPSTLKTMYATAIGLLHSEEIYRLFSPFPPGKQPKFKLTL
jgi:hypothetical protein